MLKDITIEHDANVGMAIIKELNDELAEVWNVYVINFRSDAIQNVFVTCKGYGEINNEQRETAVMRYFIGDMQGVSAVKVEPINPELFVLNNEYFLTFYENGNILDKKLTFVANTIFDDLLTEVRIIKKNGVLLT